MNLLVNFQIFLPMDFLMTLVYIGRQVSIIFKLKNLSLKSLVKKIRLLSNPKAAALDDAYDAVRNGLGKAVKGTWNSVTSWFGGGAKYA